MTEAGRFRVFAAVGVMLLAAGCELPTSGRLGGQGSSGSPGLPGIDGPSGPDGIPGYSAPVTVSSGLVLDSVNRARFVVAKPGLSLISAASRSGVGVLGAFDSTGCATAATTDRGNAHFIGITSPAADSHLPLASLSSLAVTGRMERGTPSKLRFMLIVDCNGDGTYTAATDAVVVTDPSKTSLGPTMTTYTVNATDAAFATVGAAKCGLPVDGTFAPLSSLTAGAKLLAAQPAICGVPTGVALSPIVLVQGDNSDITFRQSLLQTITVTAGTTVDSYNL
jgi:hypothetical protein